MRTIPVALLAAGVLALPACSSTGASTPAPTVTVTAAPPTTAAPGHTPNFDEANKDLACFSYGTYWGAARDHSPKTLQYALEAREVAAKVSDPAWSALGTLPPADAMPQLAALCKAAHLSTK